MKYNNRAGGFPYRSAPCSALPVCDATFRHRIQQRLPQVLERREATQLCGRQPSTTRRSTE